MPQVRQGIFDQGTNAKQFVNSLAGATVLDGQDIRAQNNIVDQHGIPVRQNVQYQNPILAAIKGAGNRVSQGLANLMGQPAQQSANLNQFVGSGAEGRDATNAQLEAYFTGGVVPENPTRGFLQAQEQFINK